MLIVFFNMKLMILEHNIIQCFHIHVDFLNSVETKNLIELIILVYLQYVPMMRNVID